MRVDTTVVETNIHYPTDSSLLGDGVRVLTRTMKQVAAIAGTSARRCATAAAASPVGCGRSAGSRAARARNARRN